MTEAYLDHAASTPMRSEARAAMVDALDRVPGNPSGQHRVAREARRLLDDARDVVARHLGARPGEVVFTSGGTEADDLAVTGSIVAAEGGALCLGSDHHAVVAPVLAGGGSTVGVDARGVVDLDDLARRLDEVEAGRPVAVVSIALANNEVGTIQPVDEVAAVMAGHAADAVLHLDAVAAMAWIDVAALGRRARLVSISGHKVGGPKGIGALVVRAGTPLAARLVGGGQERERRSGTQNVPGAVALAAALEATARERDAMVERVGALRARLLDGLVGAIPGLVVTGVTHPTGKVVERVDRVERVERVERVPNVVHVCVPGVEREALLFLLDQAGVFASAGSSCASGALEPSHVLRAMGVDPSVAEGALRLSLGWNSTDADVDHALAVIPAAVARLRGDLDRSAAAMRDVLGGVR